MSETTIEKVRLSPGPDVHARSLAISTALVSYYYADAVPPLEVVAALNHAGVPFVLIGTHALGGWMRRPRTTADVDILVASRHQKRAIHTLLGAFPWLTAGAAESNTPLYHSESRRVVVEVMKAGQPLLQAALKHTHRVRSTGQVYRIPSLEMAGTMKYGPMTDPHRDWADRYLDAHDFLCRIQANTDLNLERLAELGDLVRAGGGRALAAQVRHIRAGGKLVL